MSITLTFTCGHTTHASGSEKDPHCWCGCGQIERVEARAPKFRGHANGPCSDYENLPATKIELKGN